MQASAWPVPLQLAKLFGTGDGSARLARSICQDIVRRALGVVALQWKYETFSVGPTPHREVTAVRDDDPLGSPDLSYYRSRQEISLLDGLLRRNPAQDMLSRVVREELVDVEFLSFHTSLDKRGEIVRGGRVRQTILVFEGHLVIAGRTDHQDFVDRVVPLADNVRTADNRIERCVDHTCLSPRFLRN